MTKVRFSLYDFDKSVSRGWGVPRHFTGIRLLLVFVAINTILFLMLVTSMTSAHPWLARILPGQFAGGVNSSGYWVFFSLVLLVNAVTVLLAGFAVVVPAMLEGIADVGRLGRLLTDRGGISDDAKESCLAVVREEAASARQQVSIGGWILIAGAVFLVLAFASVTISLVGALPQGSLFAGASGPIANVEITSVAIWRYTLDQIGGALLLGAPEVYHWHFSELANNVANFPYTNFVLAFRIALLVVVLAILATLARSVRLASAKPLPPAKPADKAH